MVSFFFRELQLITVLQFYILVPSSYTSWSTKFIFLGVYMEFTIFIKVYVSA